jgi:hypothetical protein
MPRVSAGKTVTSPAARLDAAWHPFSFVEADAGKAGVFACRAAGRRLAFAFICEANESEW